MSFGKYPTLYQSEKVDQDYYDIQVILVLPAFRPRPDPPPRLLAPRRLPVSAILAPRSTDVRRRPVDGTGFAEAEGDTNVTMLMLVASSSRSPASVLAEPPLPKLPLDSASPTIGESSRGVGDDEWLGL
jgi:hypothetical protein